ncbi:hypothetical protein KZ483_14530 [Paenibacillus sp. sptzw28]|uniref:hypothetical protein n=1 Tax=Paenibacillus sp. sptzw28 TaxID=715179 RepID=UPI001C6E002B|nr:hypothetical protein [Paenibacillus sp. sptzw28]QYR19176.1 hypothetical protein KZ483_14530 [Paenibacillus sp. sptzw28]
MTLRSKYVKGMNGIKLDDELKQNIISKIGSGSSVTQIRVRSFRYKVAMISAACVIVFLLIIGGPLIFHNGGQTNSGPSTLFNGFVITAYAADGTPQVVKPDVDFPLGQYSMFMSSVPGFPITIVSKDADQISLRTSEGELLLWNPSDSKVRYQGKEAIVKSGDTIYWSPLVDGQVATESMLEITAYKDKKKLGSNVIEIKSEDHVTYKGRVTND